MLLYIDTANRAELQKGQVVMRERSIHLGASMLMPAVATFAEAQQSCPGRHAAQQAPAQQTKLIIQAQISLVRHDVNVNCTLV